MKTSQVRVTLLLLALGLACGSIPAPASLKPLAPRRVIDLDGLWQVEHGSRGTIPATFTHTVPVPGLLDMATPAFSEVGRKSAQREAFWYRREFTVAGPLPDVAILKIHKAKYGTKVFVNGHLVGEHLPCFTPAHLDVRDHLKGGGETNELIIRVGADRESLPPDMPTGWDFEKYLYLPGIYDSVELILTSAPYLVNVQTVPDLEARTVRVVAEVAAADEPCEATLHAEVTKSGASRVVGAAVAPRVSLAAKERKTVDVTIPIEACRLWSPEDPFLYDLRLSTGSDAATVRFGMRSFRFDPQTKRAVLNGRPYFLRGSNVTIYRFFEDAERGDLPWRAQWVRRLHQRFKDMHWNSLRYCIGFPPERWYDIADEAGMLIQDEFPIWLLGQAPEHPQAEKIVPEYSAWMRERWNHPCVVIWDAQNESHTAETGKALQAVRHLDLSNRPWENGWAAPQSPTDCVEAHPYLFIRGWQDQAPFRLKDMVNVSGVPSLQAAQKQLEVPIVINEYGWLWLTRDGNPTCLTDKIYLSLLGPDSTVEDRRRLYARYLAALTEFWRCHRECAGVLHFCGLGYSRPGDKPRPEGGATSDHWLDVRRLRFEPLFKEYVRDAFNPVGLMLDFWAEEAPTSSEQQVKVHVINDRDAAWKGEVRVRLVQGRKRTLVASAKCTVASLGREVLTFKFNTPSEAGACTLIAELKDKGEAIRSLRDFKARP